MRNIQNAAYGRPLQVIATAKALKRRKRKTIEQKMTIMTNLAKLRQCFLKYTYWQGSSINFILDVFHCKEV